MINRKKAAAVILSAMLSVSALTASVSALEAYDPYTYDRWSDAVPSQVGYVADHNIDGAQMGCDKLVEPTDLFLAADNKFYITDKTGEVEINGEKQKLPSRLIITDMEFNVERIMTEFDYNGETLTLKKPSGVFVSPYDNTIYIADTENSRIIHCDQDGKVIRLFGKPDSELYSADLTYNPIRVLADKAGNVYAVVKSVNKGAVMFNSDGEFLGFYGANRVDATAEVLSRYFWNLISTEEQRASTIKTTPVGFSNFDIDEDGFIYTVTESTDVDTDIVKKLNPRGYNIFNNANVNDVTFGDVPPAYYSIYSKETSMVDIDIGDDGVLNCLDYNQGRIFQYDKECNLMFIIGTTGDQLGGFKAPSAVESYQDKLYVLDSRKCNITVFKRTDFGNIVTKATELYNDGRYDEALEPWLEVLKYDGNYRRAYIGIGNAYFNSGRYEEAMKYYKTAISRVRYDKAYEGYRDDFLRDHFDVIMVVLILLIILIVVLKKMKKAGKLDFRRMLQNMKREGVQLK